MAFHYFKTSHSQNHPRMNPVLSLFFALLLHPSFSDSPSFVEVTAQPGESVHSLLREFQLAAYACNHTRFYEINRLKSGAGLIRGRQYALPIQRYAFNGKSIRTTLGISDYDLAVQIQLFNEQMLELGLKPSRYQQDNDLWVPHHLFHCRESAAVAADNPVAQLRSAVKPVAAGKRIFPIFGDQYAHTPLLSSALSGKIFYLISGHGGPDPGAVGKRSGVNLCEDEYAYDVTLRLCRKLIEHGATAYMIVRDPNDGIREENLLKCDQDEMVWGDKPTPSDWVERLKQRTDIINELYQKNKSLGFSSQQVIEIHVDSRSHSQQVDLFFYFKSDNTQSESLALQLHRTIQDKYKQHRSSGTYSGSVSQRSLYTLRNVEAPAVYIELGNIRNAFDQQRIVLGSNRNALANWLCEGILKAK